MKVKCKETCQHDRKDLYIAGKTYNIPEEIFNEEFFEKIVEKKEKGE